MASIFGALSSTAAALEAQRQGLEVAGQNIANVNTPGYSRRTMVLAERPGVGPGDAGRGVQVDEVRAVRDVFVEARLRQEQQSLSRDQVVAEALSVLEAQLGAPGASVDGQLSAFFNSFSSLAEDPSSLTLRDATVREAERVASAFREMALRFAGSQRDADIGVRATVDEINRIAADIARLNERIGGAAGIDVESLVDTRSARLLDLAALADIAVTDASGTMTVGLASGEMLLSGGYVVGLTVEDAPGTGWARVLSEGQEVTASVAGGRLGGWLQTRDAIMPAYVEMLDRLAYSVATAANAVHESGSDLTGAPGVPLFTLTPSESGAAASIQLTAAVAADARLIVAGNASANDVARDLAALRDAPVVDGASTSADYWGQIVYRIGGDAGAATRVQQGREQVVYQLQRLREATSGVSLDEEAASLMRYQRAYEANARYFAVVNEVLETLMGVVR